MTTTTQDTPTSAWKLWKRAFDQWEAATARAMETWIKSPLVLEPAGSWLSASMRLKAMADRSAATWWGSLGLPTKRDQERTLHALNQLESRLLDLEEQLQDQAEAQRAPSPTTADASAPTERS